ncbi:hypothetical protein PoHVEF18_004894 [Penicillium ochrochloron]
MEEEEEALAIQRRPLRAQQRLVQLQVPRNQLMLEKVALPLILTQSTSLREAGSDTLDSFKSAASSANGQSVPAIAQGGILGTPSAGQTTTTSSGMTTTTSSSMTTTTSSSMTTSSSASASSGTQTTQTGGSSPSATNIAENLHVPADLSVVSILTLIVAMFLM